MTPRPHTLLATAALAFTALCVPAAADPIASADPATSLPASQGAPATPHAVTNTVAPQNPFMARNPLSNIHDDTWMTDAYAGAGPLGRDPQATSHADRPSIC